MSSVDILWEALTPTSKAPEKAHPSDSGYDVFVHNFKDAYLQGSFAGREEHLKSDEKGILPGITTLIDGEPYSVMLNPGERLRVGTGILAVASGDPSKDYELQVRPRSGHTWRSALLIVNSPGTVDPKYREEIMVSVINMSNTVQEVKIGDKIAQIVPAEVLKGDVLQVKSINRETDRGGEGYGSSGF